MSEPRVLFVIHQIGSGADGGIRSIGEMISAVPDVAKWVVTNAESGVTESLRKDAPVMIWDMPEAGYNQSKSKIAYRIGQVRARLANNIRAWRTVKKLGINILHANDHRAFWNTMFGAKLAGAKVILNVRDTMIEGGNVKMWKGALARCDRFLVLSQEMLDAWKRDLAPESEGPAAAGKFAFLYSIVDRTRFFPVDAAAKRALRGELGIEDAQPALAYVGRFEPKKAQLALIREVLPRVAEDVPEAITYFVGDFEPERDAYASACADAVEALGLGDRVRFMGYSPRTADWYRAADLVYLASEREGLARCMIESLACGAPFVSVDVCSAREILEKHDCGLAVPQHNPFALAQAIGQVTHDGTLRAHFAMRGPRVAEALFDKRQNGLNYRKLLATCLD
ncbi:glycosyltransferase family 4 protein [Sphingomonas sp. LB-2]|uniref:glycosyltransferase family 4 protein n=1 Tax=Sphingomonas caeni TaxID=2984949 RepID=UPI00222E7797|nr:glycosyltransferase family 4 protein [Sphingomonas caeni]MCW3848505.1 glycosyltransferase family 4 protein [Sphingomonas caeni]